MSASYASTASFPAAFFPAFSASAVMTTEDSSAQRTELGRFEEAGLVRRAKSGEMAAFEQLYRLNLPRIYGLILRMTADRARAEELTQEAFVLAWRKLGSFRGESAFPSWLHRLAVNVVLGDARLHARRGELDDKLPKPAPGPATQRPPSVSKSVDLDRAITSLPPRARAVFVLYEVYGYRHREIASRLDITDGACKAQLHRARTLLREALDR